MTNARITVINGNLTLMLDVNDKKPDEAKQTIHKMMDCLCEYIAINEAESWPKLITLNLDERE